MPNLPVPIQTDVAIQNTTTGEVDYLEFKGNTLVASVLIDYGLNPDFHVVASADFNADGRPDLVTQSQTTGQLDFLFLDATAHLTSSALTPGGVPRVIGVFAEAGGTAPGQIGPTLASQTADGSIDFLAFDVTHQLIASDLVPGTAGLPHAVGVISAAPGTGEPAVQGLGTHDNIVTQLPDGSVDVIGFTGASPYTGTGLTYSASDLFPNSAGLPTIYALDQDFSTLGGTDANVPTPGGGIGSIQGVQAISQLANGQLDALYFDSGIGDIANQGLLYATNQMNPAFPGWHPVDAGLVAHADLFPIL